VDRVSRVITAVVAVGVLWPATVVGQELSPEQQEVWQFVEGCQEALAAGSEAAFDCFHEDFLGWAYLDLVPRTKEAERKFSRLRFETTEVRGYDLTPIGIRVHGDFAIAHYYLQSVVRGQDGQDVEQRVRWTDVLVKEDGRWHWIGDHGGPIAVTQP